MLSKYNTLGMKCSVAAFDTVTRLSLIAYGDVKDGGTEDVRRLASKPPTSTHLIGRHQTLPECLCSELPITTLNSPAGAGFCFNSRNPK